MAVDVTDNAVRAAKAEGRSQALATSWPRPRCERAAFYVMAELGGGGLRSTDNHWRGRTHCVRLGWIHRMNEKPRHAGRGAGAKWKCPARAARPGIWSRGES